MIRTNGIELHVTEAGSGPPVVLCHGFPELGLSWRHQMKPLAAAGYRVLAPDQRGYGRSSRPEAVEDYDIVHLTDDLLGLLDGIGEERAVFVGHDWGSMVVWNLSLRAPERVAGVVGMSVPFVPRPAAPPTVLFRQLFGDNFFYMLYFQAPGVADADLGRDVATTMRRVLGGRADDPPADLFGPDDGRGFVERLPEPSALPDWLAVDELDQYITEFGRTGFTGALNWYRNLDRNWELMPDFADTKVTMPAAFIAGAADPVLMMTSPANMDGWVLDLRATVLVEGAGHWVQQQQPDAVNGALLGFLAEVWPSRR